jgi:hypothetical protein
MIRRVFPSLGPSASANDKLPRGVRSATVQHANMHWRLEASLMPLYLIERNFAEKLELDVDGVTAISKINGEEGVNWLFSFLSADKRKSYCLYEATSPEAIREAARRANVPADVIIEVSKFQPELMLAAG